MNRLLKDPRVQLSATLLLIFLSAAFYFHRIDYLKLLIAAVGSAIVFDLIFLKIRKIEFFPLTAALATGLIISILIPPTAPVLEVILAAALAMFSKNFIKGTNRHIFNPAGFGVLISSPIFGHSVSWWAVSFQQSLVFYLILLSPSLVSIIRMRRFRITIPFLLTYSLLTQILNPKSSIINLVTDSTILFFSLVMLPEPMTTPNEHKIQIFFGFFVAIFAIFSSKLLNSIDPLIFALLAGNLVFYRLK